MKQSTNEIKQPKQAVEDLEATSSQPSKDTVKENFTASVYAAGHLDKLPIGLLTPLMDTVEAAAVVKYIGDYQGTNNVDNLYLALRAFGVLRGWSSSQMILEACILSEELLEDLAWPVGDALHTAMHNLLCFLQPGESNCKYDSYFVLYIIKAITAHMFTVAAQQQETNQSSQSEEPEELDIPEMVQN